MTCAAGGVWLHLQQHAPPLASLVGAGGERPRRRCARRRPRPRRRRGQHCCCCAQLLTLTTTIACLLCGTAAGSRHRISRVRQRLSAAAARTRAARGLERAWSCRPTSAARWMWRTWASATAHGCRRLPPRPGGAALWSASIRWRWYTRAGPVAASRGRTPRAWARAQGTRAQPRAAVAAAPLRPCRATVVRRTPTARDTWHHRLWPPQYGPSGAAGASCVQLNRVSLGWVLHGHKSAPQRRLHAPSSSLQNAFGCCVAAPTGCCFRCCCFRCCKGFVCRVQGAPMRACSRLRAANAHVYGRLSARVSYPLTAAPTPNARWLCVLLAL